jgi:hypothetical protein
MRPKYEVPSHLRSMYAMVAVQSMEVGTYHFTRGPKSQVPSPNYDMDAYMATLSEGEARDLCWELGQAKKIDPTLNTSIVNVFA